MILTGCNFGKCVILYLLFVSETLFRPREQDFLLNRIIKNNFMNNLNELVNVDFKIVAKYAHLILLN